jgi:hypothetical protein
MQSHTNDLSLKLAVSIVPMLLLAPALRSAEPTPWDTMRGAYAGTVTVTTKTGKVMKGAGGVSFSPSELMFPGTGVSVPRQDVKEVVIRRPREICCEALAVGILPLMFLLEAIGSRGLDKEVIPVVIIASPIIVGMAAVTGPPLLVIEGIRRLKPAQILYRVVP